MPKYPELTLDGDDLVFYLNGMHDPSVLKKKIEQKKDDMVYSMLEKLEEEIKEQLQKVAETSSPLKRLKTSLMTVESDEKVTGPYKYWNDDNVALFEVANYKPFD